MFEIEKNIPFTDGRAEEHAGKIAAARDAISKMEVGDSFVYPVQSRPVSLYSEAKALGRKVKTSKAADGQYRVWRVE